MTDLKRWLPHLGVVLGISIAVYALFFSSSDEDLIRDKLVMLEDAVRVNQGENLVLRTARVKGAFAEIFVKQVSYEIPEMAGASSNGRRELVGLAASAQRLWTEASVDLEPLTIQVDDAGMSAVAVGDATLTAIEAGQPRRDTRTVSLRFDKIDGDWLIVSLSVSGKK